MISLPDVPVPVHSLRDGRLHVDPGCQSMGSALDSARSVPLREAVKSCILCRRVAADFLDAIESVTSAPTELALLELSIGADVEPCPVSMAMGRAMRPAEGFTCRVTRDLSQWVGLVPALPALQLAEFSRSTPSPTRFEFRAYPVPAEEDRETVEAALRLWLDALEDSPLWSLYYALDAAKALTRSL